jgi:hypothetical protein
VGLEPTTRGLKGPRPTTTMASTCDYVLTASPTSPTSRTQSTSFHATNHATPPKIGGVGPCGTLRPRPARYQDRRLICVDTHVFHSWWHCGSVTSIRGPPNQAWFVWIEEARVRGGGSVRLPGGVPGCAVGEESVRLVNAAKCQASLMSASSFVGASTSAKYSVARSVSVTTSVSP